MKNNKLFTLGLIAGSMFATSCDDIVDCGCDCNQPNITSWEILKKGEKKDKAGASSGTAIIVYGTNLSDINSITFNGIAAELQPAFMSDNQIIFQVPEGISEDCKAHITTAGCPKGFDSKILRAKVAPPCAAMCDNEMATKVVKISGNSFFAPLTAKFWDGDEHSISVSTEDGGIEILNDKLIAVNVPAGVADGGTILFESKAGSSESSFIFHDRSNMLITNDDEAKLDMFNDGKPDVEYEDKDAFVAQVKENAQNTDGNFSVFWDNNFTIYTYYPKGDANTANLQPDYMTPFGVYSDLIENGTTKFDDYVIKFEVYVSEDAPMEGNGLCVGFFQDDPMDIRAYCAFWQPSPAEFAKNDEGVWEEKVSKCKTWTSGGDWMTISIPMSEIRYNFQTKNYPCSAQNGRVIPNPEGTDTPYTAFGDDENGLAYFDKFPELVENINNKRSKQIQGVGLLYASYDQPISDNEPLIAVDNLRITPKDENGGQWEMLKWGTPIREFYNAPVTSCK